MTETTPNIEPDPVVAEAARVAAVRATGLLDTPTAPEFDAITDLLAAACDVPIALVSLVDDHRQFFASHHGLGFRETPRDQAFCAHALAQPDELLVVPDATADQRFADNPLVTGPDGIRFYAGAPIRNPHGMVLGTVCLIDHSPREITIETERLLRHAAGQVEAILAAQARHAELADAHVELLDDTRELEASMADRSHFLAIAQHKLKTPLGIIVGWSRSLLSWDKLDPADRDEGLRALTRAADELRNQIDDLLDEARVQLIGQSIGHETIDLRELVDREIAQRNLDPARHPVRIDIAAGLQVVGDRDGMRHVLAHLLDNAVKYSPQGGAIEISATSLSSAVTVDITDHGVGLPTGDDDLFEPFHRGEGAATVARGTGLGLHIVRTLVQSMGGTVAATDHGDGATFTITLPRSVS